MEDGFFVVFVGSFIDEECKVLEEKIVVVEVKVVEFE